MNVETGTLTQANFRAALILQREATLKFLFLILQFTKLVITEVNLKQ